MVLFHQEIIAEKINSWKGREFVLSVKENKQKIRHQSNVNLIVF